MSVWKVQPTALFKNCRTPSSTEPHEINGICLVDNYLYFTDHHALKRLNVTTSECITIAGTLDSGDKLGIGEEARFNVPWGVAVDKSHKNAYVADWDNHKIKRVDLETREVFTLAGSTSGFVNGENGESTKLSTISRLILDDTSNLLYILEFGNSVIRVMNAETGKTSTLCSFHPESSYLTIHKGYLWISKRTTIIKIDIKTGNSTTIKISGMSDIRGIVIDRAGTIYLADNTRKGIFKMSPQAEDSQWQAEPLFDNSNFKYLSAIVMDKQGNLYAIDQSTVRFVRRPVAIPWNLERILWIGHLKNEASSCLLASLPKEMVREIITIGNSL